MDLPLQPFETLKAAGELPSPKGAALSIMKLCQRDDFSVPQLAVAIKTDPAFVGRLIKAANTVGRQGGRPVASVEGALQVLGVSTVRALALGFSLVSSYRQGHCANFDYDAFWSRSLLTGLAFQALARQLGNCSAEEAFCLGLLSGVGKLGLATVYGPAYSELLSRAASGDDLLLRSLEQETFALDHDQLTAVMLLEWGFPKALVEPLYFARRVAENDYLEGSRAQGVMRQIVLADTMAAACQAGQAERSWRVERATELGGQLGLVSLQVSELLERCMDDWREWGESLSLQAANPVRFLPLIKAAENIRILLTLAGAEERDRFRGMLLELGYELVEPGGAEPMEALLASLLDGVPQVLLADADPAGYGWLRTLRDTRQGREVFVVVLADRDDEAAEVAALEAGADEVLERGISIRALAARLLAARRVVKIRQELELDKEEMRGIAAELAVKNRRLHEVARTDVLTGFYNRRYAMERFQQEWEHSTRNGYPLACMMIDLDNFKQVNDRYGHDVGDRLLVTVAEVIRANLRSTDVTCRLGGDEFLVICPDTEPETLRHCAQRLVDAVRAVRLVTPVGSVGASLSIGVATREPAMANLDGLLKAADEGMYMAKLAGRDGIG